jgi:adenine deaminase
MEKILQGNLVDIPNRNIYYAEIHLEGQRIREIRHLSENPNTAASFICPGFVDAHVHIESSLLVPSAFAQLAVQHGTVATISDPHEIANVCGEAGVEFMIANGKTVPFKFHFGAPSCVPATVFETAGAVLDLAAVKRLLERDDIYYLSEMMNFPGVLNGDPEVLAKIVAAQEAGKPIDGHAPGLRGEQAAHYIAAGMSTDHECFTYEEGLDKAQQGMKILIREGSAAKNFEALIELLRTFPDQVMFCSDDKHPDSLLLGHINQLCARALTHELDLFDVLKAACINPVEHYKMDVGLLREGDWADFVLLRDLDHFEVESTWINGECVYEKGESKIPMVAVEAINQFNCSPVEQKDLYMPAEGLPHPAIVAYDGQLITGTRQIGASELLVQDGSWCSTTATDLLKLVVVNRYQPAPVAKAFIQGFGLKQGAIASSVAHDSHNIIAVGVDDASLVEAINLVIREQGGLSCVNASESAVLPLPVAGLMSADDAFEVAASYTQIDTMAKSLGSSLSAPFMTLSFMALLVIPELKLSDRGLFDGRQFRFL